MLDDVALGNIHQTTTSNSNYWNNIIRPGNVQPTGLESPNYIGNEFNIGSDGYMNPVDGSTLINDAKTYGDLFGQDAMSIIQEMIKRDPENATGWLEMMIGLQAERENTQSARDFESTKIQRLSKDLEAAGINPILAYQYLNGGSVGAASVPASNVSTNAVSRENAKLSAKSKMDSTELSKILGGLFSILAVVLAAAL